jgi:GH15 family glucan-1,4-alpha-glucosidase
MNLEDSAYEHALSVLRQCITPLGFKASALAGGYPQVWARDAPITSLGALVTGDPELVRCAKASLETLSGVQTELGMIPLNVDTRTNTVTTENAGAVDANLWFILGHYAYHKATQDLEFLRQQWPKLERALLWLRYQDMNDCGLLEVPEAGDWADLFANRYNILYDNVLYVGALRAMDDLASSLTLTDTPYASMAQDVKEKINLLMWLDRPWDGHEYGAQLERLKAMRLEWFLLYQNTATLTEKPYYLAWTGFREFGDYFDGFGNAVAILLGVADPKRANSILDYVYAVGADQPFPLKAFYPPIYPGDRDWREYYRSRNLNLPNQYHNGGIWPMLGGFHVAALVQAGQPERAATILTLLAQANRAGRTQEWEFNEWLHGLTGRAMGHPLQAWSAGMYLYAYHTVQTGRVNLLPIEAGYPE